MEESELNPTPILCEHITESGPFIGIPTVDNEAAYLCPSCGAARIAELTQTMKPAEIFHLLYVE